MTRAGPDVEAWVPEFDPISACGSALAACRAEGSQALGFWRLFGVDLSFVIAHALDFDRVYGSPLFSFFFRDPTHQTTQP